MSRRFGRNQKRALRKEIADVRLSLSAAVSALNVAERNEAAAVRRLSEAEASAFRKFMSDPNRYEAVCNHMAREVGRAAGENLKPYAEELMRHSTSYRPMAKFDASVDVERQVTRLTVEWPSVRFNVALMT